MWPLCMWTVSQLPPSLWDPGNPSGLGDMYFWAWTLSRASRFHLTFSRRTSTATRSWCWRKAAVRSYREGVPQRPPSHAGTPRAMSSLRSILRQRARSTPGASAWRNLRTARWMRSSWEETSRKQKGGQRSTRGLELMSAHPVPTVPGRAMSHLVPLASREGKANEA